MNAITMSTCFRPYPGELLYIWIIRLYNANRYPTVGKFAARYLYYREPKYSVKGASNIRTDYRCNLDNICKLYGSLPFFPNPETIIREMTPLTTLFPFMRHGYQAKNLEIVFRDRKGGKTDIPMMMSDVPELHACPECMAEDEEEYEGPYLHTVHQLPAIRMCPKHRIPLMRVKYRKAQDLTSAGYGELFNEDVGKCIRKLLMQDTVIFEKAIALLTYFHPHRNRIFTK